MLNLRLLLVVNRFVIPLKEMVFLIHLIKLALPFLQMPADPVLECGHRVGAEKAGKNTIVHSFNRNFAKRADGNPNTLCFCCSPEIVTALAIAGDLTFNPLTDTLTNEKGEQVKLDAPTGYELPPKGFAVEDAGYQAPAEDGSGVQCSCDPD